MLFEKPKLNRTNNLVKKKMPYRKYTDDQGNKKVVVAPNVETLDYLTLQSAYNPNFGDTGKIVRVNEDDLYANSRHHTKDIVIVDGDAESYVGFILTTRRQYRPRHNNVVLDSQKTIISNQQQPQYMEKYLTINEKDRDKLFKVDRNSRTRRVFNPNLTSEQLGIVKSASSSESNRRKSKEYRKKKK